MCGHVHLSEHADHGLVLKSLTVDRDFVGALEWTNQRFDINYLRWVKESEFKLVICVVLIVDCNLQRHFEDLLRVVRCQTFNNTTCKDLSWLLSECSKRAECIVLIVDFFVPLPRFEVRTLNLNFGFSSHRSVIRQDFPNLLHIVIPVTVSIP